MNQYTVDMVYQKRAPFDPKSSEPYKISRSKIELFTECPKCFYLDCRLGVSRPSWPAFTLNIAVDELLKKEFDIHRANNESHPLMKAYRINAVPFDHPKIVEWRENFIGVQYLHKPTNLLVFGAVDDIWVTPDKILVVVDYKSTSTRAKIDLDDKWKQAYKRQMEIYQWLLRHQEDLKEHGYRVSPKGFFVYANAKKDEKAFDAKLEFKVEIISYLGDDKWVDKVLPQIKECLVNDAIPKPNEECEHCNYRELAQKYEG